MSNMNPPTSFILKSFLEVFEYQYTYRPRWLISTTQNKNLLEFLFEWLWSMVLQHPTLWNKVVSLWRQPEHHTTPSTPHLHSNAYAC